VNISIELVYRLQQVRETSGVPMKVNSGVRCPSHNKKIGGSPTSSHMKGLAADIAFDGSDQAFELLEAGFMEGFMRMGKYDTFIHFDIDSDKAQRRLW
jgi:uncharacterized protein YcbK (DUF882 family)